MATPPSGFPAATFGTALFPKTDTESFAAGYRPQTPSSLDARFLSGMARGGGAAAAGSEPASGYRRQMDDDEEDFHGRPMRSSRQSMSRVVDCLQWLGNKVNNMFSTAGGTEKGGGRRRSWQKSCRTILRSAMLCCSDLGIVKLLVLVLVVFALVLFVLGRWVLTDTHIPSIAEIAASNKRIPEMLQHLPYLYGDRGLREAERLKAERLSFREGEELPAWLESKADKKEQARVKEEKHQEEAPAVQIPGEEEAPKPAGVGFDNVEDESKPTIFPGVDKDHMHGKIGLLPNGTLAWSPKPLHFKMTYEQKVEANTGYCFNTRVSDSLPLDRSVPDYNTKKCRNFNYDLPNLPKASVIIVFHNENFSVLIRSVHSVLNRSPPEILREVILVDDNSNHQTHPWLAQQLDDYVKTLPKTRVRRLVKRHGLMMARMAGVEWSNAPVVVFLDSHIECADRWLEPLVQAVKNDRKDIVVPFIHTIDFDNFDFERGHLTVLGFTWSLGQTHPSRPETDFELMPSPVMAGGLFAADKKWFAEELGGYDPEMKLYGGEEMELGFKTWMCGGRLDVVPCSRVGHVFRSGTYWKHQVYRVPGEDIHRNKLRAAEVWMDDYAAIARIAIPKLPPEYEMGPLDEVRAVRERCKSKSFKWYLDNIYPEMKVPKIEGGNFGALANPKLDVCIDTLGGKAEGDVVGSYPCHHQHGTQAYILDSDDKLRPSEGDFKSCLRVGTASWVGSSDDSAVTMTKDCTKWKWQLDKSTGLMKELSTGKCLQVTAERTSKSPYSLKAMDCDEKNVLQHFEWQKDS